MKKLFLSILFIVFATYNVSAQKKGDFYLGGILGVVTDSAFISGGNGSTTVTQFDIIPEIGYFVADRFMVGLGLGYGITAGDYTNHSLVIAPEISYFAPLCKNLYYTPAFEFGFVYANSDGYGLPGLGIGLTLVGLEFRPTEHFGFSASLVSLNYTMLSRHGVTLNSIDFNFCTNPYIGFKYYF